jgi:hypothetical protein
LAAIDGVFEMMLERTSRFVLEVLPYLIVAMSAAVLIPVWLTS